jgi:tripartite-type tricarboxylate transporter receptor subunit TctC
MLISSRRRTILVSALLLPLAARASDPWPSRPIHFIVPLAPGGAVDVLARQIAQKLTAAWGAAVVVDNRPGAGTIVGTQMLAQASPDGYTFGFVISSHLANPSLHVKLPYDTLTAFAPVNLMVTGPLVVVTSSTLPVSTLSELIQYAKANPGKVNYATGSIGDVGHLTGEKLKLVTGMSMEHISYKGASAALTDLLGGTINVMINTPAMLIPYIKSGKLKALAVTSAARSEALPGVPSIAEVLKDKSFDMSTFYGMLAPAGTPQAIVAKMSAEVTKILKEPDVRESLVTQGFIPVGGSPEALKTYIENGVAQTSELVRRAQIPVES